ncbi:MAG: cytochrome c [bacterium]|nr:cytochrome c [bacterium]
MAVRKAIVLRSIVLVLVLAVASGCGPASSPEVEIGPDGTPDPVLVAGRAVFVDRCSSCHDADGSGTGDGPRLNRGRLLEAYADLDDAVAVVSEGRNRMPGFGGLLTGDEIDAVLRYINEVL